LIEDAHCLDRVSAQTMAFVARRLLAERIAMVFAIRGSDEGQELRGLPELVLAGLSLVTDGVAKYEAVAGEVSLRGPQPSGPSERPSRVRSVLEVAELSARITR
jgi:hypothetical protein